MSINYSILFLPEISCQILKYFPNDSFLIMFRTMITLSKQSLNQITSQPSYITSLMNERDELYCQSIPDIECIHYYLKQEQEQQLNSKLILSRINIKEKHVSLINRFKELEFDRCDINPRMLLSILNPHDSNIRKLHFNNSQCDASQLQKRQPVRISQKLTSISFKNSLDRNHNPFGEIIPLLDMKYAKYRKLTFNSPITEQDCKLVQASIGILRNVKFLNQKKSFTPPPIATNLESIRVPSIEHLNSNPCTLKVEHLGKIDKTLTNVKKLTICDFDFDFQDKDFNYLINRMKEISQKFPNCEELTLSESCFKLFHNSKLQLSEIPSRINQINLIHSNETHPYIYGSLLFAFGILFPNATISNRSLQSFGKKRNHFTMLNDLSQDRECKDPSLVTLQNQVYNQINNFSLHPIPEYPIQLINQLKIDYCNCILNTPTSQPSNTTNNSNNRIQLVQLIDSINKKGSFKLAKRSILEKYDNVFTTYSSLVGEEDQLYMRANNLLKRSMDHLEELSFNSTLYDRIGEYLMELNEMAEEMMNEISEKMNLPRKILLRNYWYSDDYVECYDQDDYSELFTTIIEL